ncbi:thiosulfate sulfurtransferase GlpE [Erwinia sp. 9145]|uniref:thiosulfate sulfurtransferase GlpE n=1 Tax=Erwinia sp. 9145 TaxID=1500895 RepID=UPI000555B4C1|nr:thiosulfate sulfurtransferase GlpE [Erwinia sp. 9145]
MEKFDCISVQRAQALLADHRASLVDVRDPQSYATAHASGAFHLSNHSLNAFIEQADLTAPLLVMCYHGNSSKNVAQYLLGQGFTEVYSIDGGFEAWQRAFPQQTEALA